VKMQNFMGIMTSVPFHTIDNLHHCPLSVTDNLYDVFSSCGKIGTKELLP
jgi:hypothetical protein